MKLEDYSHLIEEDFVESDETPWYDEFSNTAEWDEPVAPVPRHDYIPLQSSHSVPAAPVQHDLDDLRDLGRIEKYLSRKLFNEQEE
ncbi:uncharacterized protein N7459_001635 [Penicillium hispanicum]|uniref:uncharacterized protein n=1 Tax=Penicillium hispanicum TaxID=1080232 RepID=UPI002541ECA8|nr:uncharacterized protein N7459_001635 [Penicillium hispanicum]KAJ5595427.1 hypothetical protein N7459_001635 [Penicillium hispanicum]